MFNGKRVSVLQNEKVLEMDAGDGCMAMWMHLIPYTLKKAQGDKFYVVYFTTIIKMGGRE